MGSFKAAINIDIDLGKKFFLSTGFHYCEKGLAKVSFISKTGYIWYGDARQQYFGLSVFLGYHYQFPHSKFGLQLATGPQIDFTVGTPNDGALYSGPYYRFFQPFSRFNEVDLSIVAEAGVTYKLGPGDVIARLSYLYGMSDVLEDAFIIGRSMSAAITL